MKNLIVLLLLLAVTSSCATQAQKRHSAYKRTKGLPACVSGTGCRR